MAVWCGSRSFVVIVGGGVMVGGVRRPLVLVSWEGLGMRVWVSWSPCAEVVVSLGVLGV